MNLFVFIYSAVFIALLGLINFLLIWLLHRQCWKIRGVRRATWLFPVSGILMVGLWGLTSYIGFRFGITVFGLLTALSLITSFALLLSLPFSGITLSLERFVRWILRKRKEARAVRPAQTQRSAITPDILADTATTPSTPPETIDTTRRSLITVGSVVLP